MTLLVIDGCRDGFRKVAHTKLLRERLGLALDYAKHVTDDVTEGRSRALPVDDELLPALQREIEGLGGITHRESRPPEG